MRHLLIFFMVFLIVACSSGTGNEAIEMIENGQYEDALPILVEQIRAEPSNARLRFYKGRCLEEMGRYDEALVEFNAILEIDNTSVDGHLGIAKVRYEKGDYQQALIAAQKALEINGNSAQGHFLEGRASHMMGYFDQALDSYTSAIAINRDYGEAYLYRGAVHIQLDKRRQACEDFIKARNMDVENSQSALNKYCK